MILSRELTFVICEVVKENGWKLTPDYSGRYMYGSTCFGIVNNDEFNGTDIGMKFIYGVMCHLSEEYDARFEYDILNEVDFIISNVRHDSMGLGEIIYFPRCQLHEEVFNEEMEGYIPNKNEEY